MIAEKIKAHGNNIAWWHTIFDLPFAYMGALLAVDGIPDLMVLVWITIAVSTGRAAGMASKFIDNIMSPCIKAAWCLDEFRNQRL